MTYIVIDRYHEITTSTTEPDLRYSDRHNYCYSTVLRVSDGKIEVWGLTGWEKIE